MAALVAEKGRDLGRRLEAGLVDVEVHAVDGFDLERDVLGDDVGDGAW